MRLTSILAFLAVSVMFLSGCASSQHQGGEIVDGQTLVGSWRVDLRPTPDAEAYYKDFVVNAVDGRTFTGTFYDSPISQGRLNSDWGRLHFSFVTEDGSGPYLHAGVLEGERMSGVTNSTGRGFLSVWSAERR